MPQPSARTRLAELQAQIELLKETATLELKEKRVQLAQELHEVDAEIARLTGKSPERKTRRRRADIVGRTPSLGELKELLSAVPGKTLSLRKEGLDVKHVKLLVAGSAGTLRLGGKGAWPEVTLTK